MESARSRSAISRSKSHKSKSRSAKRSRSSSGRIAKCDNSELNTINDVKQLFIKIETVLKHSDINLAGRAMIENELKTNKRYHFLFDKDSIFDVEKLLDLASKFIYIPETSDRVEELTGGGSFLISYDKTNFKYDVFAIITFLVSIVLLYISYVRFNDLYETLSAAELRSMMPKGMFDGRLSLVLEHFVSILPGCQEGNLQSRFINSVTQIVKEKVYTTLSLSTEKAKLACFTQVSSDPNSIIQYVSSGFESLFDSNISSCVTNTMANDFAAMLSQLTLNMNTEFGKVKGTVHMIFASGGCLLHSMRHFNNRFRMKNKSPILAIEGGGSKNKTKDADPNNVEGSLALGIGLDNNLFGGKVKKHRSRKNKKN
jgi:hypothetical protein